MIGQRRIVCDGTATKMLADEELKEIYWLI
jgi:hypothetical protein